MLADKAVSPLVIDCQFELMEKGNVMIPRRRLFLLSIMVLLLAGLCSAGDWPHWRGPFLNGSSDQKNLPAAWSKTENILWVASLPGHSSATPVIAGGKVFVSSTDRDSDDLWALCLDARSGKELWRRRLGTSGREVPRNNPATPSPVTDGEFVYFMYGSGDLAGLDYEGNVLWSRNIEAEYGNISIKYGYSSSPLLYDNKRDRNISSLVTGEGLIFGVPPRSSMGLLAFKSGGESTLTDDYIAWRFNGPAPDCSTPLYYKGNVYVLGDRKGGVLACLDARTGRRKWQGELGGSVPWWASVTAGEDKLYCISEAAQAVVLAADEEFKILCRIDMDDKPVQASIAIAEGHLFIRTASKLFCVGN